MQVSTFYCNRYLRSGTKLSNTPDMRGILAHHRRIVPFDHYIDRSIALELKFIPAQSPQPIQKKHRLDFFSSPIRQLFSSLHYQSSHQSMKLAISLSVEYFPIARHSKEDKISIRFWCDRLESFNCDRIMQIACCVRWYEKKSSLSATNKPNERWNEQQINRRANMNVLNTLVRSIFYVERCWWHFETNARRNPLSFHFWQPSSEDELKLVSQDPMSVHVDWQSSSSAASPIWWDSFRIVVSSMRKKTHYNFKDLFPIIHPKK